MKITRRSRIHPPPNSTLALVPAVAVLTEHESLGENLPMVLVGAGAVVALALLLNLFGTFNDEFARRSRPRIYTLPKPGEPPVHEDNDDGPALALLMLLVIIAAAVVVGVKL